MAITTRSQGQSRGVDHSLGTRISERVYLLDDLQGDQKLIRLPRTKLNYGRSLDELNTGLFDDWFSLTFEEGTDAKESFRETGTYPVAGLITAHCTGAALSVGGLWIPR
ncbi:hypothetical protein MJO28_007061 [Puccinia striiformis f. sp. tritici]|uniref:Uncharacterized protein n=2 Tax=Puccinia striiformis f. sp. tritici TaxID=168172 RepID=A0A0L0UKZ5_9BASI|nr:hypothetical protein Pst134EA_013160 [Puccinia striiformis f. sp. tritici]KAI9630625.1 hypothetical protein KEM48_013780 [Puccinia striiformis f. sp. tritici PST-130]KNE87419.1 hypothetical protein PSTG_19196 [Puccinia striiformis f. sp. tritici PST-78]KAH9465270.1 hypothetical protein Pst134EA_013160 [Puccinia striiformis f. sp. tritici]KAI7951377.1 hypothetical protein MJO28_007061 [Puccinia striiformis f. sp. tritici]KAI7955619.1 hypothetical protein MJO29_007018 [Puccinia striiformis f.